MNPLKGEDRLWKRSIADIAAGCITAVIFYPEYIGLAAILAPALPGAQATAVAGMLVIGAVVMCCVMALTARQPLLSGPRAASFALMVGGVKLATYQVDVDARLSAALVAMPLMLVIAAAFQLIGLKQSVQDRVRYSHIALRKGFMYASAVGIVVGVCAVGLEGCLRVDAKSTILVFALAVGSALAWGNFCSHETRPRAKKLAPFSMLIGMGMSVAGYYLLIASAAHGGLCATLGTSGMHISSIGQLLASPGMFSLVWAAAPIWLWGVLVVFGVLLGVAMLFENLTALKDCEDRMGLHHTNWDACIKANAAANFLSAPLGLASGSLAPSRSVALNEAFGRSSLAVLAHGVSLIAILLLLGEWIARLPQLSVVVALVLVAIQMIDKELREKVWRSGYIPSASVAEVKTTWLFLVILVGAVCVGMLTRYKELGFGLGVLVSILGWAVLLRGIPSKRS